MRLALKNLKAKKASSTLREAPILNESDVMHNYLYVQFQPQTQAEEAVLRQDSSVVLFNNCFLVDRVNSYTLKQLEQSLIGERSWWQWRDNLKSRFDNPAEQFVDELFNNWQI